jgi:E3 ubiquitin-protein ligase UBR1
VPNRIEDEFTSDSERQHCQLFMSRYVRAQDLLATVVRRPLDTHPPLLSLDAFNFLAECAYGLAPAYNAEISHLLRLCYLAELVKVVFHMGRNMPFANWIEGLASRHSQDPAMTNFANFALAITKCAMELEVANFGKTSDHEGENRGFQQPGVDTLESWYTFVKKYALVFLRKSVVFLYVKYGVDFNSHVSSSQDADSEELDRLTEALRLPTFDQMCASMTENAAACDWPATTSDLVSGWIKHQVVWPNGYGSMSESALVSHPGIFELIGLPKTYDTLIEESIRRKCPTTGQDLTDPVICLFCGEIFCSQSNCCQKPETVGRETTRIGGAQQHMRK